MDVPHSFTRLSVDGHLVCFYFLAVVNSADVTIWLSGTAQLWEKLSEEHQHRLGWCSSWSAVHAHPPLRMATIFGQCHLQTCPIEQFFTWNPDSWGLSTDELQCGEAGEECVTVIPLQGAPDHCSGVTQ